MLKKFCFLAAKRTDCKFWGFDVKHILSVRCHCIMQCLSVMLIIEELATADTDTFLAPKLCGTLQLYGYVFLSTVVQGHDTTSSGIAFTLYLLGAHEDIQRKCQAEVDEILGKFIKWKKFVLKEVISSYITS